MDIKDAPSTFNGMVLYTDGGCRPTNPGPGGYGIHGYMYNSAPPKKGPGLPGYALTQTGYELKDPVAVAKEDEKQLKEQGYDSEIAELIAADNQGLDVNALVDMKKSKGPKIAGVTPIHYIDGYGSLGHVSNNLAELMATTRGLEEAANYDVKKVRVYSDSEYVCKGLEKWAGGWAKNNWLKADGTAPANVDTWRKLVETRDVLKNRGVDVKVEWIRSHNGHVGNEAADTMATLGVMNNRRDDATFEELDRTPADGYWTYETGRHPFLTHRRAYFNTMREMNTPGEYYLGDHGKDDELLGKRISDGCYSVVRLKEPELSIEKIRDYHIEQAGEQDNLVMIRLDQLFKPDVHRKIVRYGHFAMEQKQVRRQDMYCLDGEPLTRELIPARISVRAVESLMELDQKLQWYKDKDPRIVATDLTPILYETVEKKGAKKGEVITMTKLKDEYKVGYSALSVEANYPGYGDDTIKQARVSLSLGVDLLDRNSLRRLEKDAPTVTLLSWLEAPTIFRYATVVEADGNVGIFAGVYSNLRVVE